MNNTYTLNGIIYHNKFQFMMDLKSEKGIVIANADVNGVHASWAGEGTWIAPQVEFFISHV